MVTSAHKHLHKLLYVAIIMYIAIIINDIVVFFNDFLLKAKYV